MEKEKLIKLIIDSAYEVRNNLTPGYFEEVYKRALMVELQLHSIHVESEVPLKVIYKGHVISHFRADIIVDGRVIIELKAIEHLVKLNEIQLVNYLNATGIDDGLLINFGCQDKLELKRNFRVYNARR